MNMISTRRIATSLLLFLGLGLTSVPSVAEVQTKVHEYRVGETDLRGYFAWDDSVSGPRPGVLVVHEWWGHDAYARQRAEQLAAAGYTAFALDMYGAGQTADHPEDAQRFMEALLADLPEARRRFEAALGLLQRHPTVDAQRTAALGYCLGGGLALYMARSGVELGAVVSYHGALGLASQVETKPAADPVPMMVFTGGADPMIPADQVSTFVQSMLAAGVELSLVSYPGVKHSFTVPEATERGRRLGLPLAYDAASDADSWARTLSFLSRRLGN